MVCGEAGPLLALAARPGLLLADGGRRLVQGVDGSGVRFSQMRVGVGGLRVSQLLVGRREVGGWLVFGDSSVRERRRGAVEVLPRRGQVGEAWVPIAARVVTVLGGRDADPVNTKPYSRELAAATESRPPPGTRRTRPDRPAGPAFGPEDAQKQWAPGGSL